MTTGGRHRARIALFAAAALLGLAAGARAQGPQIDIEPPPGLPEGPGRLGTAPGALAASPFDDAAAQGRPLGGRPGPSVSRAPVAGVTGPSAPTTAETLPFQVPVLEPLRLPLYGELDLPAGPEDLGPADGLTLDDALGLLIRRNLSLQALQYEIPMADADILTAGLRANPVLYADTQLVPYGRYSNARPGGQTQYDLNVNYPLDVSGKRRARTEVARRARKVTEAQFQDAVRRQIDNLYTAYVDAIAADETLRYSRTSVEGLERLLRLNEKLLAGGRVTPSVVDTFRAQVEQAQLGVREAGEALVTANRALALLLDLPPAESDGLKLRGGLRDLRDLPAPSEALVGHALQVRPDLLAYRLGVDRSRSEIGLARANRYNDVYVLYQPYTYQDNRPLGLKSATSWALGVTATMPVYNRNQGNIRRAELNHRQTQAELTSLERRVAHEVDAAAREFRLSRSSVLELEREVIPAARRVRDTALRRFEAGEDPPVVYLEAQRQFNEVVRQYRDALVRHRRSMLDLNTAVGARILP